MTSATATTKSSAPTQKSFPQEKPSPTPDETYEHVSPDASSGANFNRFHITSSGVRIISFYRSWVRQLSIANFEDFVPSPSVRISVRLQSRTAIDFVSRF